VLLVALLLTVACYPGHIREPDLADQMEVTDEIREGTLFFLRQFAGKRPQIDLVQTLLESDVSGKHVHIAKYDNVLEGNVYELTLGRK
jgi:hypothetical protein